MPLHGLEAGCSPYCSYPRRRPERMYGVAGGGGSYWRFRCSFVSFKGARRLPSWPERPTDAVQACDDETKGKRRHPLPFKPPLCLKHPPLGHVVGGRMVGKARPGHRAGVLWPTHAPRRCCKQTAGVPAPAARPAPHASPNGRTRRAAAAARAAAEQGAPTRPRERDDPRV